MAAAFMAFILVRTTSILRESERTKIAKVGNNNFLVVLKTLLVDFVGRLLSPYSWDDFKKITELSTNPYNRFYSKTSSECVLYLGKVIGACVEIDKG